MYIGNIKALITVYIPIDLTILNIMPSKGAVAKQEAFNKQVAMTKGRGCDIDFIQGDAGDGFGSTPGGPHFIHLPPGRKDGIVETKIRRVNETIRKLLHSI